jgi:hypothetical protein
MAEIGSEKGAALTHIFQRVSAKTGLDVETIRNAVYDELEEATNDEK